ncbi:MAG TPA: hypothetical protein VGG66_08735 [Rhizomicrobium sp.]|jgi:hypothetical protein
MRILIMAAALTLAASCAFAQDTAMGGADTNGTQTGPQNPAIKGIHQNNSGTPVKGANSFTREEAQMQIEAKGYTNVAGLTKDQDGVWRGTAEKNGATGPVSLDYQGNVN